METETMRNQQLLGKTLQTLRIFSGYTLAQAAAFSHISPLALAAMEQGEPCTLALLQRLCRLYGVTVGELLSHLC